VRDGRGHAHRHGCLAPERSVAPHGPAPDERRPRGVVVCHGRGHALTQHNGNGNNNVKAGICYVLFDEQFEFVSGGYDPVNGASAGGDKLYLLPNVAVPKTISYNKISVPNNGEPAQTIDRRKILSFF
jgi:hypothetical protein